MARTIELLSRLASTDTLLKQFLNDNPSSEEVQRVYGCLTEMKRHYVEMDKRLHPSSERHPNEVEIHG